MPGVTVALSLISHTNAGKTTLARTLLARDVGEVRDAPHVTTEATAYTLIETEHGDRLALWDTPGFGDSARLARRLGQQGNPIGWFLSQVWDRWRDHPFWLTQLAVRHVRDDADVVLYLVNAAESPEAAAYVQAEMQLLHWMQRPVIVLLPPSETKRPGGDGAPLDQSIERHLFEPFFSSESRSSGLGLYICRELCERHGASIAHERNARAQGGQSHEGNEFFISFRRAHSGHSTF